jgi:magnesium chelatase subunit D
MFNNCFPFSAVLGQDRVKMALILNIVNPNIGGVLISGEKGTGKSTVVRGLPGISKSKDVVELPLNITEDRLVGSIDLKKAIVNGEKGFERGILYKAHNQILYIDEVNLLSEHIVNILLEVMSRGVNVVEREGISYSHPSKFILVGSMNPEEGILRPQLLDKFGLYVEAKGVTDIEKRMKIIKMCMDYENNPVKFSLRWKEENNRIKEKIDLAKGIMQNIKIDDGSLVFAVSLAEEGNCAGHRGEIILIETAKAIAALNQRKSITKKDIEEAASFVLPHRLKDSITLETKAEPLDDNKIEDIENDMSSDNNHNETISVYPSLESSLEKESDLSNQEEIKESIEDIVQGNQPLSINIDFTNQVLNEGSGKRSKVKTNSQKGRYIKYTFPKGKVKDIAFDATLRAAASKQKNRDKNGLAICIKQEDFREKVREKQTGATILFAVDASGSMGAKRRMGAVKGAVLSLLNDAYQKRDNIGIVVFRKDKAEVMLNITRSVDLAEKCLRNLPTGGKTPLAAGLYTSYQILKTDKIKNPDSLQYLIVVSDGKANIPLKTKNSLQDVFDIGEKIRNDGIKTMVIDTEDNYIEYGFAKDLAEKMDSDYIKINRISKTNVETSVKNLLNINK